jgi:hypothetical protein
MVTKTTMATNHDKQEPIGISRSIISMAISKENPRKTHTHTPEAYDDFKHGISKAKGNKNNLQSYD